MQNIKNVCCQDESTIPVHIYFTTAEPPGMKNPKYAELEPSMNRKFVICSNWGELSDYIRLCPASICINALYFKDRSFIEVYNMFATFTNLNSCCKGTSITLGINKDTPFSLIKEAQKSNITGIIPSSTDYDFEETLRGIQAQFSNIPYWPKHIIDQLPGAKKPKEKTVDVRLTGRQQQVFDIVITRGCSNKHIAKLMGLSESTVKLHLSNIFKKYGVKNRTQLALFSKSSTNVLDKA